MRRRPLAGVLQQETAGAVGVLRHPGGDAHLAEQGGLLVAGDAGDGNAAKAERRRDAAVDLARWTDVGQHAGGHPQQLEQILVPLQRVDVEQHGPRRVRDIRDVRRVARELPHQPAVDGSERQLAGLGPGARAGDVVENPRDLAAGKIGVDDEPGAFSNEVFVAVAFQAIAEIRRPTVLPDDRVVDGLSSLTVPHDGGLALVGDADGGDVSRPKVRAPQRLGRHRNLRRPDLAGVMFNPARTREDLLKLALSDGDDGRIVIEDDRARAGGALVEGDDVRHGSDPGSDRRAGTRRLSILRSGFRAIPDSDPSSAWQVLRLCAELGASIRLRNRD